MKNLRNESWFWLVAGAGVVLLLAFLYFAFFRVLPASATNDNVTICHKNNGNGWSKISVDPNAINGFGNGDHNDSNHQNGQDIIPPGYWDQNGRNWTQQNQAIYNNNCNVPVSPTPTVIPTATPEPTKTPEPTITPTPEPTPTPDPCIYTDKGRFAILSDEVVPCEEEPTPTPVPQNKTGAGNPEPNYTFQAPICVGEAPKAAIALGGFRIDVDSVNVYWHPTTDPIDFQLLRYGYTPDSLVYGIPYLDKEAHSVDLNFVLPNTHVWFQVGSDNDNCVSWSNIIDP